MVGVSTPAKGMAIPLPAAQPEAPVRASLGSSPVFLGRSGSAVPGEIGIFCHGCDGELFRVSCEGLCNGAECCSYSIPCCRLGSCSRGLE